MKKLFILILTISMLSGCASYKFQKSQSPGGAEGYTIAREEKTILEYTVGKDNSLPDLKLAKTRFKRRKGMVEYYYKNMDYIRNRFHDGVRTYGYLFVGMATSIFRMPAAAISDYRYEHDPQYKAKVNKIDAHKEAIESARIAQLKMALNNYMQKDIAAEENIPAVTK